MHIRYDNDRLRKKLTVSDFAAVQAEKLSYDAIVTCYAAFLWDHKNQEYYDFDEAKTMLLASPMRVMLELADELTQQIKLAALFGSNARVSNG